MYDLPATSNMQSTIPSHLISTYNLIQSAFANGVDEQSYFPLLSILTTEMSDRNLAQTISYLTHKDYAQVLNDIYAVQSSAVPSTESVSRVLAILHQFGYEQWLKSE